MHKKSCFFFLSDEGVRCVKIHCHRYSIIRSSENRIPSLPCSQINQCGLLSMHVMLEQVPDPLLPVQVRIIMDQHFKSFQYQPCHSDWLAHFWTIRRGDGQKDFQVGRSSVTLGYMSGCIFDKIFFFFLNKGIDSLCKCSRTCIENSGD